MCEEGSAELPLLYYMLRSHPCGTTVYPAVCNLATFHPCLPGTSSDHIYWSIVMFHPPETPSFKPPAVTNVLTQGSLTGSLGSDR